MRTIDTDKLKPLGGKGAGPWRMDDGTLLRVQSGGRAIPTEGEAREMLETYRACAAVAGTPRGLEVVRLDGGFGVVVDYVSGIGLGMHVALGSYAPNEAGREMGALLHALHARRMAVGRDWNETFRRWSQTLRPLLPAGVGDRLAELVADVPDSNCLLHGDFHIGNVVMSGGSLALIDMESAGFGHPVFDLAIARSRTLLGGRRQALRMGIDVQAADRAVREMWSGLLAGYFEGTDMRELDGLEQRIEVLSEVESCCLGYGAAHIGEKGPDERQRERINRCAERLAEPLPQVDRLDF